MLCTHVVKKYNDNAGRGQGEGGMRIKSKYPFLKVAVAC